ncbi:ParB/RepB/Spo0J family partition protein [Nitrolancea hollandica]|uniref:Putative chromosome-partitioning protein parB n=1 Tax=Nitrolancea hollandica Lb TaxID=1129897 RepID=I4EGJ2_9BACT|nr:ParB/RepB/Spo0J family partition protein [Nitrolancea hollandica]CCF83804.1 putative chromosome-partitioning protein parB [Nitrolancea hollandica Lb]
MAQRKGGLGRGLDSLIPSRTADGNGVQDVEIDAISPNPYQPRDTFAPAELEALAGSIREHGVIQPLIVARGANGTPFQLIVGERRWRAARMAGLRSVPVIVRESTSRGLLELALIENIQRADLSVLEEAAAYRQLIAEFGITQAEVAERVGRSRVAITNALRILDAPEEVKEALSAGTITEGHARALLGLPLQPEQVAALQIVVARDLNVRQTEQLVREWRVGDGPKRRERAAQPPIFQHLEDGFRRALGTKVELRRSRKGGQIVIHYFSEEELDGLYKRIVDPDQDEL